MVKFSNSTKNVLPNTYIPVISKKDLVAVLTRLPKLSLIELVYVWPKMLNTQPHINSKFDQKELNRKVTEYALSLKNGNIKVPKRKIIDKILFEFWSRGLNLLQLSQVDCQLIVDRPNAYYWNSSTVIDSFGKESPISLEPKTFLESLSKDLSSLYMSYVYVCRHPSFPLVMIRVQVFDLPSISSQISRPHIASRKPFFLAIPLNSPHIIHSPGNDLVTNIILQVVERSLQEKPMNPLKITKFENQIPVRSLESMHILNGNSRFGNSLGIWTPYADGTVDSQPLEMIENNKLMSKEENGADNLSILEKTANLRFKGSIDGQLKSEKLYDDNKANKRRRIAMNLGDDDEIDNFEEPVIKNEFASITPIQYSEFIIKNKIGADYSSIKIKLTGMDVFAGLHELSVHRDCILDPSVIPGWITGEEGISCGVVIDGVFTRRLDTSIQ